MRNTKMWTQMEKKQRRFGKLARVMLALLCLLATSLVTLPQAQVMAKDNAKDKTLVIGGEYVFELLNPILHQSPIDSLVFRGLMAYDEHNKPVEEMAESVDVSDDQLTYTFHLKEGLTFQDGQPVTADDVIFTLDAIKDEKNASYLAESFGVVDQYQAIDSQTVSIHLKEPFAPFLDAMTAPILPKHAFKTTDMRKQKFNRRPFGSGPYVVDSWKGDEKITLSTNDHFYGEAPRIKKVQYQFVTDGAVRTLKLKNGELDLAYLEPNQVDAMEKSRKVSVFTVDSAEYRGLMFNMRRSIWKDPKLRQAISYAIDRENVIKGIFQGRGEVAYSPLQKTKYYDDSLPKISYQLDRANQLLDEIGWKKRKNGFRYKGKKKLSFGILTPVTDTGRTNLAHYLADSLKQIGADVNVVEKDWSQIDIEKEDSFLIGWGSPFDPDIDGFRVFHSSEDSLKGGQNYGAYANKTVDKALEQGRATLDEQERFKNYSQFQAAIIEDPAYAFINYQTTSFGHRKDLKGMTNRALGHRGSGFFWNVEKWYFDAK